MRIARNGILSSTLITFTVVFGTALTIWADYRETTLRRQVEVTDITKVVESTIQTSVTQGESFIDELAFLIMRDGGTSHMAQHRSLRIMRGICHGISGCNSISIIDPNGISVANTAVFGAPNIDVSDRAYFRAPQKPRSLYISPAIVTRLPGHPIQFALSKAVYEKNGKFLGVVSIGMNTDHFTNLYQLMGFALSPTITVFKSNGDLVARQPEMNDYVGKNFANSALFSEHLPKSMSGIYESSSATDEHEQLAAYRALPSLDLVIFAGIDKAIAYEAWRKRTERMVAIIGLALIIILGAVRYCFSSMRLQQLLRLKNDELDHLSHTDGLTGIANAVISSAYWNGDADRMDGRSRRSPY